jgi:DnaK suppressor protein
MNARRRFELAQALRRQRAILLKEYADTETDLRVISEDREPEFVEHAQNESAACILRAVDDRVLREIAAIDGALQRMIDGTYGRCLDCGAAIPLRRLHAAPAAASCLECARDTEGAGWLLPSEEA